MTKVTKLHQQHTQTSKQEKLQTALLLFLIEINTLLTARPWAERASQSTRGLFFAVLSVTRRRSPLGRTKGSSESHNLWRLLKHPYTDNLMLPILFSLFFWFYTARKIAFTGHQMFGERFCKGHFCTLLMIFDAHQRSSLSAPLPPRSKAVKAVFTRLWTRVKGG